MHTHVIETERLILRPLSLNDAEAEFVWLSDPIVNRYMPYNLYTNVADVAPSAHMITMTALGSSVTTCAATPGTKATLLKLPRP